jgi:hypothetical protein
MAVADVRPSTMEVSIMSCKSPAALRADYERLNAQASRMFYASTDLWNAPEFAAVREAMDRVVSNTEQAYYMAWFLRFVSEWAPLNHATVRSLKASRRALRAWQHAERRQLSTAA